jgi:hypothetical protein
MNQGTSICDEAPWMLSKPSVLLQRLVEERGGGSMFEAFTQQRNRCCEQ